MRSEAGCRAAPNSNVGRWGSSMAPTLPPLGGVAFALALTSCARAGPLLAPISCLARAITPRAPSADRLRGAIGATQNTLQSLSCRGQYGCSVVKGVPPAPDCPCIALASCLARAAHGLTDPHVHTLNFSRSFLLQLGAGLLAGARRAACLQLSCCAPGSSPAYNHCAGWMGLCPSITYKVWARHLHYTHNLSGE